VAEGADVVCFSGGKAVGGPQGSGILCGRKDLISAVALQHLDLDVHFDLWNPPPALIDKHAMPGAPQHGIGRPCKVGKEQIVGLMVALKKFVAEGDDVRHKRWAQMMIDLAEAVGELKKARVEMHLERVVPMLQIHLADVNAGVEVVKQLMAGTPSVHVNTAGVYEGVLGFNPICLSPNQVGQIANRLRELLG